MKIVSLENFLKMHGIEIVAGNVNKPVEKRDSYCIHPTVNIEALLSSLQGSEVNPIKMVLVGEVEADDDVVKQLEYDAIKCIVIGEYSLAIRILRDLL